MDKSYKPLAKFQEYEDRVPKLQEEIDFFDDFLDKGVTNDLITWSEKAKKERRGKNLSGKKKGGRASSKESKKEKAQSKPLEEEFGGQTTGAKNTF